MNKPHKSPPLGYLLSELEYEPATGIFKWKRGKQGRAADLTAGYASNGYLRIFVAGKSYQAHRLAFFMMNGREPADEVDHIDGDTMNNAASNLREATRLENSRNRKSSRGFQKHRDRKKNPFQARIKYDGKIVSLGVFPTEELARAAYEQAANKHFGEFSPVK